MPIKIPNELPAVRTLEDENIFVMTETRAVTQDIRPLKILILNLMPTKVDTETQLCRLLGNTPLQVEPELIHTRSHVSKNTPEEHLLSFYRTFDEIRENNYDGLVITGAPVESPLFRGGILGGTEGHHGMVENARLQHAPHLLGRAGRSILPLRHRQSSARAETVRRVPTHGGIQALHSLPRV